jgi:hypothetical protein
MEIVLQEKTFKAWINNMPGPGAKPTLIVTGDTDAIEVDWKVVLVRAVPQGINPNDLLLKIEVTKPTGAHSNALASRTLRYEEKPAQVGYHSVTILNADHSFTIPVEIVE